MTSGSTGCCVAYDSNFFNIPEVFMKDFVIYSYQFAPVDNDLNLFFDVQKKNKELMMKKNIIFDSIIDDIVFKYRNKVYKKDIFFHKDDIIIMRLANHKSIKLEKGFHVTQQDDEPSCIIIIDNRNKVQRVAIEKNTHSFSNTDTIKNILLRNLSRSLQEKELALYMQKEYLSSEFWDICNKNKGKITKVVFSYKYPNLGRAHEQLKKLLGESSSATNSSNTQITYTNTKGLVLSQNDDVLSGCVIDSSEGGEPVSLKIKGYSSTIKTGKTTKEVKIDEVDINNANLSTLKSVLENI